MLLITTLLHSIRKLPLHTMNLGLASAGRSGSISYISGMTGSSKNIHDNAPRNTFGSPVSRNVASDGLVMVSDGNIVFANKAFFLLTGYEPEDIFGLDFASLVEPSSIIDYTMLSRSNNQVLSEIKDIQIRSKNNQRIVARFTSGNQKPYEPRGTSLFLITNATEGLTAKTPRQLAVLFELFENVETYHWVWDDAGLIYMNKACRQAIKHPFGKVINDPWLMLSLVDKPERAELREQLNNFYKSGSLVREVRCKPVNGQEKWYKISLNSSIDPVLRTVIHYGLGVDITDDKKKLIEANREKEKAVALNMNKSVFLSNMSHEIRSPLNGIIGFSELLADPNLSEEEREKYMGIIQKNGEVLTTLLSDLIDISKIESGKLEIMHRKFLPSKLLNDLNIQFNDLEQGRSKDVELKFVDDNSLQYVEIYSDPFRLRQILINLISNALKFTYTGNVEVGLDYLGDKMMFWVKDTGTGIPYAKQAVIFERFSQASPIDFATPIIGFGLGLSISRSLVELLGGNLWVESMPERGSIFQFTINTNTENSSAMEIVSHNEVYPYDFREHTLLIAEDIDFSFLYIEAVLRRTGAKILWAQNGKEAVEFVKINDKIDLVLMDMHMPVMTGYEATEIITRFRPDLPVIAQTAFALPDDMKRCYDAGCSGFLAKPIRKELLLNTISEYLERSKQPAIGQPTLKAGNA